MRKNKNCPLDANEHPDLAARCNRGEWIPSKGEVDSFRLMDDYIDDAIQVQMRNRKNKNCPLDANEHPDLAARCNRGEWIPSKGEVDSFRLMDDYIPDEI